MFVRCMGVEQIVMTILVNEIYFKCLSLTKDEWELAKFESVARKNRLESLEKES